MILNVFYKLCAMSPRRVSLALIVGAALAGCANLDERGNEMLGGAVGGASGAAIGGELGGREGAVVGAGVGAAAGAAVGQRANERDGVIIGQPVVPRERSSRRGEREEEDEDDAEHGHRHRREHKDD